MNLQSLVVVLLRLMALHILVRWIVQFAWQVREFMWISEAGPLDGSRLFFLEFWLLLAGMLVAAVVLWAFALPIARFVTRGVSDHLSLGSVSLADCYSVAFIGLGLFYLSSHLPQVLNWMHYLLKTSASGRGQAQDPVNPYDVSQVLISFIIGVVLFLRGRTWALALARHQGKLESPKPEEKAGAARGGSNQS